MRDAFIIFFAIVLSLIIGAYLFFNGSDAFHEVRVPEQLSSDTSFTVISEGTNAGAIDTRTNYRIMSDTEFSELWTLVYGTSGPSIPVVDFSKNEVIAVFDGSHSSGGYRVQVTDVRDANGKRTVHIRREEPKDSCITTQAITSPFQIIRAPKTTLPVAREEETVTVACQ